MMPFLTVVSLRRHDNNRDRARDDLRDPPEQRPVTPGRNEMPANTEVCRDACHTARASGAPLAWVCPSLQSSDDAVRHRESYTSERGYQLRPGHRPRSYRDGSERSLPHRQRRNLLAPARLGVADHRPRTQAGYGVRPRRRDHRPPARVGVPPLAATGRGPYAGRPGPTRGRRGAARRRHAGDPRPRLRPFPPGPPPHARADGLTTLTSSPPR